MNMESRIGTQISECTLCRLVFRSVAAFDKHRVGLGLMRRCLTRDELVERGWRIDNNGNWSTGSFKAWDQT